MGAKERKKQKNVLISIAQASLPSHQNSCLETRYFLFLHNYRLFHLFPLFPLTYGPGSEPRISHSSELHNVAFRSYEEGHSHGNRQERWRRRLSLHHTHPPSCRHPQTGSTPRHRPRPDIKAPGAQSSTDQRLLPKVMHLL